MKKQTKFILFIVLVVVLVGGVGIYASANRTPGKYDEFAKCISNTGTKFYGTFWCPHCNNQKKMFGSSKKYLPYIECSSKNGKSQLQVCKDAGIAGYPTWIFADGTKLEGEVPMETLAEKTQCTLPPEELQ